MGVLRNTGHDKGYDGDKTIDKEDPHYNWDMGTFFINGYSGKNETADGVPIFLKNVGDKITLWFNLKPSLNTSNQKNKLKINPGKEIYLSRDVNGYDRNFGTEQTDLGYGALMIQYTDEDGVKHDPIIYTDYLYASTRTGADKRVFLFEEGDYEVHLDYELVKPTSPITEEYNDYQISFKFCIRNGNCMAYPFDVATGSELEDKDVTKNGFRLDFAKSRYLDLNVIYEVVERKPDGSYRTYVRYNRPAKEKKEFTDPGIYTINVTNTNTKPTQQTKKTYYVGNDGIISALANSGKNLEELNELISQGYEISSDGFVMNPKCETYPFDIANGIDLRDRAITANGFELDLSKSRYIDINVVYSKVNINADGTGSIEVVDDGTAGEGKKYVDAGIYTIDAINSKTKPVLHTTKTIYVGNSAFLKALSASGDSVDEINELIKNGYKIDDSGNLIEPVPIVDDIENIAETDEEMSGIAENTEEKEYDIQQDEVAEKISKDEQTDDTNGIDDNTPINLEEGEKEAEEDNSTKRSNPIPIIMVAVMLSLIGIVGYRTWIYIKNKEMSNANDDNSNV